MTDSPTGFTYRERLWWLVDPDTAPRKVVMAALREAKFEGVIRHSIMGGTREEVREGLRAAIERRAKLIEARQQKNIGITAADANSFLQSLPPPELP